MNMIKNPILTGFNPDPSMIRVNDDYYIATSTFQWWPGVLIHHSKDLINWHIAARPLDRVSQLDLKGCDDSCGVWAPCLSYHDGIFYLIYTDVKTRGPIMDVHNYLVTSDSITGPWSEPVYLNSTGFDPSIFHDDDGKHYILNMLCDYRKKEPAFGRFAGILLQEYNINEKKLIGKPVNIFRGTQLGYTEGPNMYKHNGYYYLICAEGGTGYNHAATVARAKTILGEYEIHPKNPILTSKDDPALSLQRAGHASIIETKNGHFYMAHLASRPITEKRRSVLGRETCLQKFHWGDDNWPYLEGMDNKPKVLVPSPCLPEHKWEQLSKRDDFDSAELRMEYNTLRIPLSEDLCTLKERKGYLRLYGAESLNSKYTQSLVARRQQHFRYTAQTCLEFEPENHLQSAGLIALYDTNAYICLSISYDDAFGKYLSVIERNKDGLTISEPVAINEYTRCYLKICVDYEKLCFFYSKDGSDWTQTRDTYDASILSDEYNSGRFTGAYVGICVQDLGGTKKHADFDYFEYEAGDC